MSGRVITSCSDFQAPPADAELSGDWVRRDVEGEGSNVILPKTFTDKKLSVNVPA